jgi:hypothetical protein
MLLLDSIYQTTQHHISEVSNLHSHCCENLKFQTEQLSFRQQIICATGKTCILKVYLIIQTSTRTNFETEFTPPPPHHLTVHQSWPLINTTKFKKYKGELSYLCHSLLSKRNVICSQSYSQNNCWRISFHYNSERRRGKKRIRDKYFIS